jgi:protein-export membrane protein SecD
MLKTRIIALLCLGLGIFLGVYVYQSEQTGSSTFKLGLDLSGGSYLVYKADVSKVDEGEINISMDSLRDVIERRINAFGVSEPNVQTETHTIGIEGNEERLIVELPGVTDLQEAVEMIGQTPLLEFKIEASKDQLDLLQEELKMTLSAEDVSDDGKIDLDVNKIIALQNQRYVDTELTGKYLEKAQLQFSQAGQPGGALQSSPIISLSFDKKGAELFEEITTQNVGKSLAIYLDGVLLSAPQINTPISGGQAIIEGSFTLDEAKIMVGRLNSGALPIPIELISTSTIGPSLGQNALNAGVRAGIIGFIFVAIFLILWYRLPGLVAAVALSVYTAAMMWMFKFIPVTLTAAGIAGFIISIGIAVDANILIFERMKEEMKKGVRVFDAVEIGFKRAWSSIRDSNISSIISAFFLFWFGTALIKGFALTFGLGILISMLTAVTFTRLVLLSFSSKEKKLGRTMRFLYKSGFNK